MWVLILWLLQPDCGPGLAVLLRLPWGWRPPASLESGWDSAHAFLWLPHHFLGPQHPLLEQGARMGCTQGPSWFPSSRLGLVNSPLPQWGCPLSHLEPWHTLNIRKKLPSLLGTQPPGRGPEEQ